MKKMNLGKEFSSQLAEKKRKYSETAGNEAARKSTLRSNTEWADDVEKRTDADLKHRRSEYHVKNASWKLPTGKDEEPREYSDHSSKAFKYRISASAALFIEIIISAVMFFGLLIFGWSFAVTAIVAVAIATVVTLGIAYLLHGGVAYLVDSPDPLVSLRRLRWLLIPSICLIVAAIISYVAIQRLDPITLLIWEPYLASAKFVAMLGLLGLGVSLLVAADVYSWNAEPAAEYQEIQSVRQEIISLKREWADELNEITAAEKSLNDTNADASKEASAPQPNQNLSLNGNTKPTDPASLPGLPGNPVVGLLIITFAIFMAACTAPEAPITVTPVVENVEMDCVVDVSGVKNYSALQEAGRNILNNSPEIVKQNNVKTYSVLWFGANGWTPETKLVLDMPAKMQASTVHRDMGDIGHYRPDVVEAGNKLVEKQIKNANASLDEKYGLEVEGKFSEQMLGQMIPPRDKETVCTDINGLIGHYAQPDSTKLHLIYVITDARQNCGEDYSFQKILVPQNKLIIFIIVPGTEADGMVDFELRKSNILAGCPSCVVVPYNLKDLNMLTKDAIEKRLLVKK